MRSVAIGIVFWGAEMPGTTLKSHYGKPLTPAERQVLSACLGGATSQEIAVHLGKSVRTVETQRLSASAKLGARSALHLGYLLTKAGYSPPAWTVSLLPPAHQERLELLVMQQLEGRAT